jgi:DNA-directed RNA polymerase specialized sigma24 family protein
MSSKIPASTLSGEKLKKEETEEEEEEEEEEEQQEEDDYYDQEDYGGEVIDEEEKKINQAEDKQRTIIFNQAIKTLKSSGKEPTDTGMVIQIN